MSDADLAVASRIGVSISRLMRAAGRAKARDAATGGAFHSMALLVTLSESGPLRLTLLAEAVFSDLSTVSRRVAALVDQGLIAREPDPEDGRATLLAITDAGRAEVAAKLHLRDLHLARMTASWSVHDRASFADLLDRFSACFAASVSEPAAHGAVEADQRSAVGASGEHRPGQAPGAS